MLESRLHLYCGNYDHMVLDPSRIIFDVPVPISPSKCEEMVRTLKFESADRKRRPITINAPNIFTYFKTGTVFCMHFKIRALIGGGGVLCVLLHTFS